jgi:predicted transcriptional regulator
MKQKHISEFEQEVMTILWGKKTASVKDVQLALPKGKSLAYNTVGTILERLYEKEFINKKNRSGVNMFSPRVSKKSYSENIMKTFLKKFMTTFGDVGFASFVKSVDTLPKEKREYFLTLLKRYDKKL